MSLIRVPKAWEIPDSLVTSEDVYLNRRAFLKASGAIAAGGLMGGGEGVRRSVRGGTH
jgi:hypothetical protein